MILTTMTMVVVVTLTMMVTVTAAQNVSAPYNNVGAFELVWTPLPGPEEEDAGKDMMDVETEDDLLGKPWTYR